MFLRIHIPPIYVPIYVPVCACVCRGSTCVYVCACEYCRRKIYFPSDNTIHTCNDHWLENIFSFRQYTHAMIIDWKIYIFFFQTIHTCKMIIDWKIYFPSDNTHMKIYFPLPLTLPYRS